MKRIFHKRAKKQAEIAKEHIITLLSEADKIFTKNKLLANHYALMAHKIMLKFKLKLPNKLRKRVCKHCHNFLKPGVNCRVRIGKQMIIYYCLDCKHHMRFRFKEQKKT